VCDDRTMAGENEKLLASLGGVELVLSALGNHSSHAGVQIMGLSTLQALAVSGSLRVWLLSTCRAKCVMVVN